MTTREKAIIRGAEAILRYHDWDWAEIRRVQDDYVPVWGRVRAEATVVIDTLGITWRD